MFWKKKKANQSLTFAFNQEYNHTIDYVNNVLSKSNSDNEKINVIEFFCQMISKDMQYDILTTIFYSENYFKKRISNLLPSSLYNELGEKISLHTKENKELDLAKDCVIVLPWNRERMINSILYFKKHKFQYDELNHYGYYYKDLNFSYVYNGIHSTTGGIGYQQGKITVPIIDVSKAYEHLYTDGCKWYNRHTKEVLLNVQDFRVAILYELNRLKSKLK